MTTGTEDAQRDGILWGPPLSPEASQSQVGSDPPPSGWM